MADIPAALKDWSATTASNSPSDATTIGTGLDDNLREIQASVVRNLSNKGADIASASTTDLGAVEGLMHDITGTTTITSFGTVRAGIWKVIKFEGVLTLTHNGTSLILPGAANITTANGDTAIFMSEGSGNWRCLFYQVVGATPVVIAAASQSEQETGALATVYVSPARQQHHRSAAKWWAIWDSSGTTLLDNYNVSSVTNTGTGDESVSINVDFSSANWAPWAMANSSNSTLATAGRHVSFGTITAGAIQLLVSDGANPEVFADALLSAGGFGDQP